MFGKKQFVVVVVLVGSLLPRCGQAAEDLTEEQRQELVKKVGKLNEQANGLHQRGAYREATAVLREVLATYRILYPKEKFPQGHPDLARSLSNLGFVLQMQREYAKAESLLREALAMNQALFPRDQFPNGHPHVAVCLNNLGLLFQVQGQYARAEPFARDALAMRRALYPREKFPHGHPDLAISLNSLGYLLYAQGGYARAEPFYREALAINRALYPREKYPQGHPHLAISLNNLGHLLQLQGEYGRAEPFYRESLALYRALYPREKFPQGHPLLAGGLNNLGYLLRDQGEYARAEPLFRDALAMNRALYPKEKFPQGHPDLANSLNSLGHLLQAQRRYAKAEPLVREALAMRRALFPKEKFPNGHPTLTNSLINLGVMLLDQGEYAKAEPIFREALAMNHALFPKEKFPHGHPDLAQCLNNLGEALVAQGEYAKAEPIFRDALAMRRALFPREQFPHGHPHLAVSLASLGFLFHAQGEYAKAEPFFREALAIQRGQLSAVTEGLSEAQALNFAATFPMNHHAYLCVTRRLPAATGVYDELWQRRATIRRILERRHLDLLASKDPKAHQLGRELLAARQRLARLLLTPARDSKEHSRLLNKATEDKEELEKRLVRQLRVTAPSAVVPPPPSALADALPNRAVFIDLMRYTDFDWDRTRPGKKGERWSTRYVAFILRPGQKTAERVELGPGRPIEQAWLSWREAIVNNRTERAAAARFARLAWEPIRKRLPADLRIVYLSADLALTQVPWSALPGAKPGSILLEEHAVAVVPHGPWLLEQLKRKPRPPAADDLLLAVGGIAYDRAPTLAEKAAEELALRAPLLGSKRAVWKDLPGTAREHEQIVALARKLFRKPPLNRSGTAASTGQLQEDLPRVRYAHLATHGFFADGQFRSAFQVDEKSFERLGMERQTAGARSPLVLSGLVLAGANRSGKEASADRGILTAEALVGLNLHKMDLAVLSACDSGVGTFDVAGGEGVYSLQRAFHLAGCHNVIASLWKVDDNATAALMGVFYRNLWVKKMPPLEALRQAQLFLYRHPSLIPRLAKRRGPDFAESDLPELSSRPDAGARKAHTGQWAAFVLSGTGR